MQARRNLTNRLRSLLGLADMRQPAPGPGSEQATIVSGDSESCEGFRLPDFLLERYEVKGILGRGAFGVVYLAKDSRIGRLIAIKQLYRKHSDNRTILSRFIQEARIAGQLEHPNIVTIFDVTGSAGAPCIVMEYLGGGNLATLLRSEGVLPEFRALTCIRGVFSGLAAAHRLRVIHRDVKPANILFDRQGAPKLGDFGVAHLPLEAGGLVAVADETPAGTPDYMAPEQTLTDGTIDGRADLYSAGALLYRMVTGGRVYEFADCTSFDQMAAVIRKSDPLPQIRTRLEAASPGIQQLILGLLARHPGDRPADADIAMELVDQALESLDPAENWQNRRDYRPARSRDLFADLLRLFLVDGIVTPPERHELTIRAARLGVSEAEALEQEEAIRREMGLPQLTDLRSFTRETEKMIRQGDAGSPQARAHMRELAARLGISIAEQRQIEEEVLAHLSVL